MKTKEKKQKPLEKLYQTKLSRKEQTKIQGGNDEDRGVLRSVRRVG